MKNKIVLITGATSGIGWATALEFKKAGAKLILCGRRKKKLEVLDNKLGGEQKLLNFDVRDKNEVFKSFESLPENWKDIDLLLNNAGTAHGLDPVQSASIEDWDSMIDGNVEPNYFLITSIGFVILAYLNFRKNGKSLETIYLSILAVFFIICFFILNFY